MTIATVCPMLASHYIPLSHMTIAPWLIIYVTVGSYVASYSQTSYLVMPIAIAILVA